MTQFPSARRTLVACLCTPALLVAPLVNAQAHADVVSSRQTYTLADGPICGGTIQSTATTQPTHPGTLLLQAVGTFLGFSGSDRACTLGVRIAWRNLSNGRGGAVRGIVAGFWPAAPNRAASGTANTGPGLVEFWLESDRPFLPGPRAQIRVR